MRAGNTRPAVLILFAKAFTCTHGGGTRCGMRGGRNRSWRVRFATSILLVTTVVVAVVDDSDAGATRSPATHQTAAVTPTGVPDV